MNAIDGEIVGTVMAIDHGVGLSAVERETNVVLPTGALRMTAVSRLLQRQRPLRRDVHAPHQCRPV